MDIFSLQSFFHTHCKIKLKNGKVVFGVIFPNLSHDALFFTSFQEHKRVFGSHLQIDIAGLEPLNNTTILPDEIISVEPIVEEQNH